MKSYKNRSYKKKHSLRGGEEQQSLTSSLSTAVKSVTPENLLPKEYLLTFVDVNGCSFSEVLNVDYIGGYNCISVPVVISPNNDGTNDLWHPINDLSTEIEVSVLNRWGQSEYYYKGNSMNFEWNGINSDGNELPSNDYYYIIQFRDKEYSDLTGVITLIR